jgi:hypothetical protein
MVVPGTKCSKIKFEKFIGHSKRGFSTGLKTHKNVFLNVFFEFLGDLVP